MRGTLFLLAPLVAAAVVKPTSPLEGCPGYTASNVKQLGQTLTADLELAGDACNTYGTDLPNLKLLVETQTDNRLHVMIYDAKEEVYQVPEYVLPRPESGRAHHKKSALSFDFEENPFSFRVLRGEEVLFDTSDTNIVFQSQYLNLRTWLPNEPNLYGLGEHTDSLRLPTEKYTRTIWNRDAYAVPEKSNLYGDHPLYIDHRGEKGTHGVFFLNSNGMDIKIDKTEDGKQYLEYNTLGGVLDFYFMAGPTPKEVSEQYSEVVGLPVMQSYWSFGYHNCRYGYQDVFDVAEVVYNYSRAGIPLETMWTDIDYMDARKVFTLDDERFPLQKMRGLVSYLHKHHQKYIVMVDPAVSHSDNGAFNRGSDQGAVWPGVTVFPDWFNPDTQSYWNSEFRRFFSARDGVDIDGLWIDMNEAANFCPYPCANPAEYAEQNDLPPAPPPVRSPPRKIPGFPADFQPGSSSGKPSHRIKRGDATIEERSVNGKPKHGRKGKKIGLPGRDLINPPYQIANEAGSISNKTIDTDLIHAGEGYAEYDTHNLYGTMMSSASREAMLKRRPHVRPLVITRSTFAGAGTQVGHWLGDNVSDWEKYRISIAQMLAFASFFQVPMVGSDVCGFAGNTTEELCARWAMLGGFYPFYRNHNEFSAIPQEFYRWPTVTEAAKKIIDIRYRLLDYLYTSFHHQTVTGSPFLQPLFYVYPEDSQTFGNELQFFYGDSILVSPVSEEGATSVDAYFPKDLFYDWFTGAVVQGEGAVKTISDLAVTDIPIHIRGGSILPLRTESAMTTKELRKRGFEILIAPGADGSAEGELYLDDGESIRPDSAAQIQFEFRNGKLKILGRFGYRPNVVIEAVTLLGQKNQPRDGDYNAQRQSITKKVQIQLTGPTEVTL
ncbi:Glycoside hydrolase family 31 [Penicillium paradoxum]|uniref:Glycoside hydrolase family 31 n=1 Tax=Penicillium paradoxum TaxID=176176 RepID=UPI0025498EE0|nr:Glycoside hydrolase family 31 [Penicillium paradoxum]KAJ5779962.1 Glycoside hydrolase family 31 [Penicillium paradoxum]